MYQNNWKKEWLVPTHIWHVVRWMLGELRRCLWKVGGGRQRENLGRSGVGVCLDAGLWPLGRLGHSSAQGVASVGQQPLVGDEFLVCKAGCGSETTWLLGLHWLWLGVVVVQSPKLSCCVSGAFKLQFQQIKKINPCSIQFNFFCRANGWLVWSFLKHCFILLQGIHIIFLPIEMSEANSMKLNNCILKDPKDHFTMSKNDVPVWRNQTAVRCFCDWIRTPKSCSCKKSSQMENNTSSVCQVPNGPKKCKY